MTMYTVKAQKCISKKSEEKLSNGFVVSDSIFLERRKTCRKLPSSYTWCCIRPWPQTQNLVKKLPQKALIKVNFKLKTLIVSYLVMWFAVHGGENQKATCSKLCTTCDKYWKKMSNMESVSWENSSGSIQYRWSCMRSNLKYNAVYKISTYLSH